jgi:hypothetical protein
MGSRVKKMQLSKNQMIGMLSKRNKEISENIGRSDKRIEICNLEAPNCFVGGLSSETVGQPGAF